ncbi:GNAT family N-acetyltransferase [Streptomyces sp. NPDC090025]|uniref:GNAT family N-acetyltransferase n=1 Tax=Streptomyces sp. NPDC090025 TaxID=3365922 RepID=UPI003836E2DF
MTGTVGATGAAGAMDRTRREGDFRVRPRTDDDLDTCVAILAGIHRTDGYPVNWPAQPVPWVRCGPVETALGAWVAELDGRIVGHVTLTRYREDDLAPLAWSEHSGAAPESAAMIGRLFVAPEARGHRAGVRLMAAATAEARRLGLRPVLDVADSGRAAIALYERLGWQRLSTSEEQWGPVRVTVHSYAAPPEPESGPEPEKDRESGSASAPGAGAATAG